MNKSVTFYVFIAFRYITLAGFMFLMSSCSSPESQTESASTIPSTSDTQPEATEAVTSGQQHILFFGDSISAGFGLEESQAFPALIQQRIDSLGWEYKVTNGGLSGDTSAGGLSRIKWMLRQPVDVFILELGGNDGLRGTSPAATKTNLQAIIDEVKRKNPDTIIILAGMQIPPNMGQDYTEQFKNVFPELATENDAHLIPFILDKVGGIPELNLPDGIHPTAEGHKIVAETVWNTLEPLIAP